MRNSLLKTSPLALSLLLLACATDSESGVVAKSEYALETGSACSGVGDESPLAQAACGAGRLVGAAVAYQPLTTEPAYASALAREFTYVTAENAMKWGSLQPTSSTTWDFTQADAIVNAARANGQLVKGHALVWHQQLPPFVNASLNANQLDKLLRTHMKQTLKRYAGKVVSWDVVNEAVQDDGSLRQSVFLQVLGPNYIRDSFIAAHEYDPSAKLYYNDYGIEVVNPKSNGVYALLRQLVQQGVPVHGIGMQAHIDARYAPTSAQLRANFQRFAELGLAINLSELDVRVAGIPGTRVQKLALQQQIYHQVVSACLQTPACDATTVWGVSDKYSWIDGLYGADDPLPLADDYTRKPAYYGMVDALVGLTPDLPGTAPNLVRSGSFETDAAGFGGFGTAGVTLTTANPHTGKKSALGAGRTASWQGPAVNLTDLVLPAFEYDASAFARVAGAENATVSMSLKTQCSGQSATYQSLHAAGVSASDWTQLAARFTVPNCTLQEVTLYFEGPAAGVDIALDDVAVRERAEPLGPSIVGNGTFESGVSGWFGFGNVALSASTNANTGAGSLLASGRTDTWQGPATSLLGGATAGATYRARAFAKIAGASSAPLRMTIKSVCDGSAAYTNVAAASASDLGWVELSGSYQVPLCSNLSELTLYFEGPAAGVSVLLDDVSVAQRLAIPVVEPPSNFNLAGNGGGELGIAQWANFGSTVAQSSAFAHSGTYSIVGAARAGSWAGPAYGVPAGEGSYKVEVFALQNSGAAANLTLSAKTTCNGADSYPFLGSVSAESGTWVKLSGTLNIPSGCSVAQVYINGPDAAVDIYADDLTVVPATVVNLAANPGLESGATGWQGFGAALSVTTTIVRSGAASALVTGRTADWQGGAYAAVPTGPGTYAASIAARHAAASEVALRLSAKLTCGGVDSYPTLATVTAPAGTWVTLGGNFAVPDGCTAALVYVHQAGGAVFPDLYLDDLSLLPVPR